MEGTDALYFNLLRSGGRFQTSIHQMITYFYSGCIRDRPKF